MTMAPPTPPIQRIVLLRHGATLAGDGVLIGRTDPRLSAQGEQQIAAAWARLGDMPFLTFASSPRQRCADSARHLAAQSQHPCQLIPALAEIDFGAWEGESLASLAARDPQAWQAWRSAPAGQCPPGGEAFDAFSHRVTEAFTAWRHTLSAGRHLLLTHGGVIRTLLAHAFNLPWPMVRHIALPHGAWVELSFYGDAPPYWLSLGAPP